MISVIDKENVINTMIAVVRKDNFQFTVPASGNWAAVITLFPYTTGAAMHGDFMTACKFGTDLYVMNNGIGIAPISITQSGETATITFSESTSFRGVITVFH